MCPLHSTSWGLIAQHGEVDMEMVVGGLVVQVDSQLTGRKFILLQYGFLRQNKTGDHPACGLNLLCLDLPNTKMTTRYYEVVSPRQGRVHLTFPFWKTFFSNGRCSDVNPLTLLMPFW